MSTMNDPAEPNEHVTVVEALAFKLRRSMTNTGLRLGHDRVLVEDLIRLVRAIVQEALPISVPGPATTPAPALPTVELVDAVRTLVECEWGTGDGRATVNADAFLAVRLALIERDRRASPCLPPPPAEPFTIGVRRRLDETLEAQGRRLEELTTQLRGQAERLDERQARIEDLERNLGRVEAERQGLADQLARPPSVRAMEQALLRDLSRADLPDGHYVPRYGPNAQDNMVCSDGHVVLATGDGEQGSDILYLSIYPAARDAAGRSRVQSAKLSAVARLLWNASRLVNERTR